MSKSKNTNPNIYRSKWDMSHGSDTDYSRSKSKRELDEVVSETTGSNSKNEDEDLKPFWEEDIQEEDLLDQEEFQKD